MASPDQKNDIEQFSVFMCRVNLLSIEQKTAKLNTEIQFDLLEGLVGALLVL